MDRKINNATAHVYILEIVAHGNGAKLLFIVRMQRTPCRAVNWVWF